MIIIGLAIINALIWVILTIRWKNLRKKNISPISAYGLICAGLPLWLVTFVIVNQHYHLLYSNRYFINLFGWIILCMVSNLGGLFIMKFKALSQLSMYKLALSTLVAMIIEILFYKNTLHAATIIGVLLLLAAGFLLPANQTKRSMRMPTNATLALLFVLSIIGVLQTTTYKNAVMLQSNPLLHGMLAQILLYVILLAMSFRFLKRDYVDGKITLKDFAFFGSLIYVFTINEAYLFKELPIVVLVVLSVLNILLYQIYDVKNKELKHSWKLYLATCIACIAIFIIKFSSNILK